MADRFDPEIGTFIRQEIAAKLPSRRVLTSPAPPRLRPRAGARATSEERGLRRGGARGYFGWDGARPGGASRILTQRG